MLMMLEWSNVECLMRECFDVCNIVYTIYDVYNMVYNGKTLGERHRVSASWAFN